MHRVDNSTAVASLPAPSAVGPNPDGYFSPGDPGSGTPATRVNYDWANAIQEELCYVIEQAGLTLDKTVRTQLKTAIDTLNQNNSATYAESTSAANTYTATLTPAPSAYSDLKVVFIKFTNANTDAATINLNGLGAVNITDLSGAALTAGMIAAGMVAVLAYDGTNFQLCNPASIVPFSDSTAILKGSVDATKLLRLEIDGQATATTRVWTTPDCDLNNWLVQRVGTVTGVYASGTTTMPYDDTMPQNTEGVQFMTQAITPKNTSNILVITAVMTLSSTNVAGFNHMQAALFQDTTANALGAIGYAINNDRGAMLVIRHVMTAGTTSATTFKIRGGSDGGGTTGFNGTSTTRRYGGVACSSITIEEYAA